MKILHSNINHSKRTNFTSINYRYTEYLDMYGIPRATQNTTQVRDDLDCKLLAKIIKRNFKQHKKINLMPMNASDLTETYAITTALIDEMGIKTVKEKMQPIIATDVDDYIINKFGKQGYVALNEKDIEKIGQHNIKKFFSEVSETEFPKTNCLLHSKHKKLKTNPEFASLFKAERMDLQKRIINLKDKGNSIIAIRNCLAQSFGYDSLFVINNLGRYTKKGSLLLTGDFDMIKLPFIKECIKDEGFYKITNNIYRKGMPPAKDCIYYTFINTLEKLKNNAITEKIKHLFKKL